MGNSCPSEEALLAFHRGTLAEDAVEAVGDHLEACPLCAAVLEQIESAPDPVLAALRKSLPVAAPAVEDSPATWSQSYQPLPEDQPIVPGYEVLAALGRGGMGVVYKARHVRLNRMVALKQLRPADARQLARARVEAEALARLQHPHILQIHEIVEIEGRVYLALELVEGGALGAKLAGKPQIPREAAALLQTLARAVHYAHDKGIVHRDLKPANILLHPDGTPRIADFGLARLAAADDRQTREGDLMGTPCYMAPEQAAGTMQEIGPATDVYGLGVLLYEMLTGRVPFEGPTTLDTLVLVRTQEPVPPRRLQPRVLRDLEIICLKCLQKEPRKRYAGAGLLADDLGRFLAGEPIRARPAPAWERAWKWAKRRPAVAALSAAIVLVTAAALVLVVGQWRRAEERRQRAEQAEGTAEERRRRAEEAEARLALRQGLTLCEQGEVGTGLLWLARGLEQATSAGAASLDRPLRINLAAWGRQLHTPRPPLLNPAPVLALTFDPTGRLLLAAGKDGRVHWWDVDGGREIGPALVVPPEPEPAWVTGVAFSPDGRTIATAGPSAVTLWDAATRRPLGDPLPHPPGMVQGLAFFPDGKRLATIHEEGHARIWDLAPRKMVGGPLRHAPSRGHYTLAVNPDGENLLTAGEDGAAVQVKLPIGIPTAAMTYSAPVEAALFTPDGRKVLTAMRDGTLNVWDLKLRNTSLPWHGNESCAIAMAPDGRHFATANGAGVVRLWQTDSLRPVGPVYRCRARVQALAFSPDSRRLAMGMDAGIAVAEWTSSTEAAPPAQLSRVDAPANQIVNIHIVCYTLDGGRLMAGTRFGIRWLDTGIGKPLGWFQGVDEAGCTALAPDGKSLAAGRVAGAFDLTRGRVELHDLAAGGVRWQTPIQDTLVAVVAYSPDGRSLFSCGSPGGGALWDVGTGRRLRPLMEALGRVRVRQAVFHPGGRALLLACDDGRARLWDVDADAEIDPDRPLEHPAAVTAAAIDATGGRLLTGCRDGTVRLWDGAARVLLLPPLRHEAEVSTVSFSPDGRLLLTGSLDGAARFWDTDSGQPLGPTLWHSGRLQSLAFHPGGQRVAGGGEDAAVCQWHAPAPPLEGSAEHIRLWAEALSGLALDGQGAIHELSAAEIADRRRRLAESDSSFPR